VPQHEKKAELLEYYGKSFECQKLLLGVIVILDEIV